jgi:hypothetical protein
MVKIGTEELSLDRVRQPRLEVVLDHWNEIRRERPMPSRRDIDPQGLKGALGIVMIARFDPSQDDFRFSLFGTEIVLAQRTDYTNKLARDLEPKAFGELISSNYRQARTSGHPFYGRISLSFDRELVSYHRLVLPLGGDGGQVDALLVASEHEKSFWKMLHDAERERSRRASSD